MKRAECIAGQKKVGLYERSNLLDQRLSGQNIVPAAMQKTVNEKLMYHKLKYPDARGPARVKGGVSYPWFLAWMDLLVQGARRSTTKATGRNC